jgi:hypothetical protein
MQIFTNNCVIYAAAGANVFSDITVRTLQKLSIHDTTGSFINNKRINSRISLFCEASITYLFAYV